MKVLDIDGLNYYDGKIKQTYATKTELNAKAPLASPALTGTPTAPTPTAGDDSTKLATTAYVQGELSNFTPSGSYLPLTGGTMTGDILYDGLTNDVFHIGRTEGDGSYDIGWFNGNSGDGANIALRSAEFTTGSIGDAGEFRIIAKDSSASKQLIGRPNGTLTWNGNKVATFDSNNKLVFPDGTTMWVENIAGS